MSKQKSRRSKSRRRESSTRSVLSSLERFRITEPASCDSCGQPAAFHAPMWAEPDPYLISFWAHLCERCLLDRQRVLEALRGIRGRGWARPGLVPTDDELPPREPRHRL